MNNTNNALYNVLVESKNNLTQAAKVVSQNYTDEPSDNRKITS